MTWSKVLIRVDASASRGVGHAMRCIGLAQELTSRGAQVQFAAASLTPMVRDRLVRESFEIIDVHREASFATVVQRNTPQWVVIDLGIDLRTDFTSSMVGHGASRVLVIDDTGQTFLSPPALVLNQNLHAGTTEYHGVEAGDVLRGPSYLLLRNEFLEAAACRDEGDTDGVLLSLGGTDPLGRLPDFAEAISSTVDASLRVVAPSTHPEVSRLRCLAARPNVTLHEDVSHMAELMTDVRLAVTSGGTTVWELAVIGVPAIVGSVNRVEDRLLDGLREHGLFDIAGSYRHFEPERLAARVHRRLRDEAWLASMSRLARATVDGHGRRRVVDAMEVRT